MEFYNNPDVRPEGLIFGYVVSSVYSKPNDKDPERKKCILSEGRQVFNLVKPPNSNGKKEVVEKRKPTSEDMKNLA